MKSTELLHKTKEKGRNLSSGWPQEFAWAQDDRDGARRNRCSEKDKDWNIRQRNYSLHERYCLKCQTTFDVEAGEDVAAP